MSHPEPLSIVGWKERLDFPDWGLSRLRVKIDTGARTSSLHAERYEVADTPDGPVVRFLLDLAPGRHEPVEVVQPVVRLATVRSSTGLRERRPVVSVRIRLGHLIAPIELTLTNRGRMRYRILLGRAALAGRFLIDTARTYLLPRPRRRQGR